MNLGFGCGGTTIGGGIILLSENGGIGGFSLITTGYG